MSKDYAGQRFTRLLVLRPAPDYGEGKWWCRCDCGTEFPTSISAVAAGRTISCGCYRKERARALCATNRRRTTPCEVIFQDGRMERFESVSSAARALGVPVPTLFQHLGEKYNGFEVHKL